MVFLVIAGFITRAKFHGGWKFTEAAAILCGMGYGVDNGGNPRFDVAENVDIHTVELGENAKVMIDAWNKYTSNWLRRYVYVRVPFPSLKLSATLFMSAFWHGIHSTDISNFSRILS